MAIVGRLDQYASMLANEFDETTANNPSITGLGTYYASEFNENITDDPYVEYLIVAGGGGGGGSYTGGDGGGGGAGGLLQGSTTLPLGDYSITVGAGGAPGAFNGNVGPPGYNGGNSIGFGLTAIGGGGGGSETYNAGYPSILRGVSGGSGGGGIGNWGNQLGGSGTVGQGNAGGTGYDSPPYIGGGGGGAGQIGSDGYSLSAGKGGDGKLSSISGISTYYAGGGSGGRGIGGGLGGGGNIGVAGVVNTGGGGGRGAAGGSGIIIARYIGPQRATGGTVTSSGGYTIHTFTTVGISTFTILPSSSVTSIKPPLSANIFPPYDPVYDEFSGTSFGAGQGRYMRQNTDKSVIVYNEIDEITDLFGRGIVRDGLVLDLDAGISASYSGSGTTWTDLSGNGNNGTLVNGVGYSASNYGSLSFDGTNDFISNIAFEIYNNFSYDIWCLPQATHEIDTQSTSDTTGVSGQRYLVAPQFVFAPDAGSGISVGTNGVSVYEHSAGYLPALLVHQTTLISPTHIVVNYTNKTPSLYLNGVFIKNGLTSLRTNVRITTDTLCGYVYGYFSGIVYNFKFYNRALSAAEVSQNYNALKGRFGL